MPHPDAQEIARKKVEHLQDHLSDQFINEADYHVGNFLAFLNQKLSKPSMEALLSEWIETRDGQRWYAIKLDELFREVETGGFYDA